VGRSGQSGRSRTSAVVERHDSLQVVIDEVGAPDVGDSLICDRCIFGRDHVIGSFAVDWKVRRSATADGPVARVLVSGGFLGCAGVGSGRSGNAPGRLLANGNTPAAPIRGGTLGRVMPSVGVLPG
jgi:hypothetical protein